MKAIIIGAGRGRRLMPTTADTPKCYTEIQGRRTLDWALRAFAGARVRGEHSHGGGYGPILPYLNRLKVHHLTMEFTAPQSGDMAVFKELREDLEIGLGCVDVTPGQIDSAETIADRVRQALMFLAPERVTLNPDCGFAPGSGAAVSIDEAYSKLCNEAEAARMLREEYA